MLIVQQKIYHRGLNEFFLSVLSWNAFDNLITFLVLLCNFVQTNFVKDYF